MKDEKKSFHNPHTVVIKEENRKKKLNIDFTITQQKVLLNLDEFQEKAISFELKLRQTKTQFKANFENRVFFHL